MSLFLGQAVPENIRFLASNIILLYVRSGLIIWQGNVARYGAIV